MSTAINLITRALRRGRVIGRDQTAAAEDAADALEALNALLDLWWNERLAVYRIVQEQFALVAGQASRTIGPGANFNTTRPVKLAAGSFIRRDGKDYPLTLFENREDYDAIFDKTIQGIPEAMFYDPAFPTGTIYFYYVPDAADALFLNSYKRLESLATLTEEVELPPGYDNLVVNGLAVERAPEYGKEAPASVQRAFVKAMAVLKRANSPAPLMSFGVPLSGHYDYEIESGA